MAKKPINELGIEPRDLTLEQRRELFLKRKREAEKDWRVLKPDSVEQLVPFNRLSLDYGLKLYGMAGGGTVYHIHGDEGSGKSTLAADIAMNYINHTGEGVAYYDYERRLQSFYLQNMGIDMDHIYVKKPDSIDDGTQLAIDLMNSGVKVHIFDSIPRMRPRIALEDIKSGAAFKRQPGEHARAIQIFWDIVLPYAAVYDCTIIMVNQTRSRIEMTQQAANAARGMSTVTNLNYTLPGGRVTRFSASVMIENMLARAWKPGKHPDPFVLEETPQKGEEYLALEIRHRTLKNTVSGTGYRQALSYIRPGRGMDENISLRSYARQMGLIENHGKRWFVGESLEKAVKVYDDKASAIKDLVIVENPEVLKALRALVVARFEANDFNNRVEIDDSTARYLAGENNEEGDEDDHLMPVEHA